LQQTVAGIEKSRDHCPHIEATAEVKRTVNELQATCREIVEGLKVTAAAQEAQVKKGANRAAIWGAALAAIAVVASAIITAVTTLASRADLATVEASVRALATK
jgi:hypothetical protein